MVLRKSSTALGPELLQLRELYPGQNCERSNMPKRVKKDEPKKDQELKLVLGNENIVIVKLLDRINNNICALIKEIRDGRSK